ncbi:MAG: hypothetical protein ABIR68_12575 [Ilumatobacteraceae bacterium]
MADLQRDTADELVWDLRALEAAIDIDDERLASAEMIGTAASMLPSLHLNLADVYLRLREFERARGHLAAGRATLKALPGLHQRLVNSVRAGPDRECHICCAHCALWNGVIPIGPYRLTTNTQQSWQSCDPGRLTS